MIAWSQVVAIETGLGKYLGKFSQPSFHRSPAAGQVRRQINLAAHITVFMNTIKLRITWTMGPCNFFVRGWPTLQTAESACRHVGLSEWSKLHHSDRNSAIRRRAAEWRFYFQCLSRPGCNPCKKLRRQHPGWSGFRGIADRTSNAAASRAVEGVSRGGTPKISLRPKIRVN